jgi:hypothetical protein
MVSIIPRLRPLVGPAGCKVFGARPTSQLVSKSVHCRMETALTRNCRSKSSSRRKRTFIRNGISNRSFAPTVALLQPQSPHTMPITISEVIGMFDVYVRGKNQVLVIRRGAPLPAGIVGSWRKKRAARAVSDEISGAVLRNGFYTRLKTPGSILPQTCEQVRMPAKNY